MFEVEEIIIKKVKKSLIYKKSYIIFAKIKIIEKRSYLL